MTPKQVASDYCAKQTLRILLSQGFEERDVLW